MILETKRMSEDFLMMQEASRYSMWLVATIPQRCEHLIVAMKRFGANTYGFIHCTVQKWSQIQTGVSAFFEVYEAIKKWDRRYGEITTRYSLIIHGRKGTPKGHTCYMFGAYLTYTRFEGKLTISKVNRKVKVFVAMLRTSKQYGAEIATEQELQEKRTSFSQRMREKKVLKNWYR
jgi:hypothetical protein